MKFIKLILPIFKNFYFSSAFILLAWVLFFDVNDIFSQWRLTKKKNELEYEKQYYMEKIQEVNNDRAQLLGSTELIEKFARERYLMKKPTEEIYLIDID
ncbi:MAG: septum formation initiator family protein [Cytophagales bacterium]|nr:septum formation initiator family protein [Cytophagales bacterium]